MSLAMTKRRTLLKRTALAFFGGLVATGHARAFAEEHECHELPPADPDPTSPFAVDRRVNMETIDEYLGIPGVVYRDMRMVDDPAAYGDIGGDPKLSMMIDGFTVAPFPFIGSLAPLPVAGAYEGPSLFDVQWGEGIEVLGATARYTQSLQFLEEVFPKDKQIVLMCGGGGYAGMMRSLLVYLGWEADRIYNAGGFWEYEGDRAVQIIAYNEAGSPIEYFLWRAPVVTIDFKTFQEDCSGE